MNRNNQFGNGRDRFFFLIVTVALLIAGRAIWQQQVSGSAVIDGNRSAAVYLDIAATAASGAVNAVMAGSTAVSPAPAGGQTTGINEADPLASSPATAAPAPAPAPLVSSPETAVSGDVWGGSSSMTEDGRTLAELEALADEPARLIGTSTPPASSQPVTAETDVTGGGVAGEVVGLLHIEANGRIYELAPDRLADCIEAQQQGRRVGPQCPANPSQYGALLGQGVGR